jgi:hypothetical protein
MSFPITASLSHRAATITRAAASAALLTATSVALAGPTFEEVPDAGSTPATAQPTTTSPALGRIKGELTTTADAADFQDMFLICITDPEGFTAKVDPMGTEFDTRLWLFKLDGKGLLANDNDPVSFPTPFSALQPNATDGSGAALVTPGLYFLAISTKDTVPVSAGGPIFNDPTPNNTEITGPDGPGGGQAIQGWTAGGNAPGGKYAIDLTGVKPFAPSCTVECPLGAAIDADAFDCDPFDADPNGGCSEPGNPIQPIGSIAPGMYRSVCGTMGVESNAGSPVNKDRDYYRINVAAPGYLALSLVTKTPGGGPATNARLTLVRGTDCNTGVVLATTTAPACPLTIGPTPVTVGEHTIIVTLDGSLPAGPPCPTTYVLYADERPTKFDACGSPFAEPCGAVHASPGCNRPLCCDAICTIDPACCEESWDASCVALAIGNCPSVTCEGDLDGDGVVGGSDLAILLGQWGGRARLTADLNNDDAVDAADLAILLGAWGPCI